MIHNLLVRALLLPVLLVISGSVATHRRAEACHDGGPAVLAPVTIAVAAPMTFHDAVIRHSSLAYAVSETAVMGLLSIVNAIALEERIGTCEEDAQAWAMGAAVVWSAALAIHGIYELLTERRTPVAPTVVNDGDDVGAGVAWTGTF